MLKPDRREVPNEINYSSDPALLSTASDGTVFERGGIAVIKTVGSGGYPGDANNIFEYAANPSGKVPLGVLLYDVVKYDTNRQHDNWFKSGFQARLGMKAAIAPEGWYTTNMVPTGDTINGGEPAYLAASGKVSVTQAGGAPRVGTFMTKRDADGYVKLRLEIL